MKALILLSIASLAACATVKPASVVVAPTPAPMVAAPERIAAPMASPKPLDPRIKYTTSPDCHYVNYDGSCKSARYPSYRIQGR